MYNLYLQCNMPVTSQYILTVYLFSYFKSVYLPSIYPNLRMLDELLPEIFAIIVCKLKYSDMISTRCTCKTFLKSTSNKLVQRHFLFYDSLRFYEFYLPYAMKYTRRESISYFEPPSRRPTY